ncbi:hypothetical protein GCM10009801_33100 [Streptomyces albiaxialis]|uniref:Tat pathway signal sequence domain protein n=1 Tax=Streptomyces albiaxialis TaxID=329523 RepID=A0ABN2W0J3_9ACTN
MSEPPGPDTLVGGSESPPLRERWAALPRTVRRGTLAGAALALVAAGTLYAIDDGPAERPRGGPRTARLVPYPAQSTDIRFVDIATTAPGSRTFSIALRVTTDDPVTISRVTQGYEALDVSMQPRRPLSVTPENPRNLGLRAHIRSCEGLPLQARMPFLEVTLRNARASQHLSVIPGDRYARALTRVFRTVCEPPVKDSAHTP